MTIPESIRAISNGFLAVMERKIGLAKALIVPSAIYLMLMALVYSDSIAVGIKIVVFLLALIPSLKILVTTHRAILIGETNTSFSRSMFFGVRERKYLLALVVALFYCLLPVIFTLVPVIGDYVTTLVSAYIFSRISLMFPSIAIDVSMNARESWQATRSHQTMIIVVNSMFFAIFTAQELVMKILGAPGVSREIVSLVCTVFFVSAISEAYKVIVTECETKRPF